MFCCGIAVIWVPRGTRTQEETGPDHCCLLKGDSLELHKLRKIRLHFRASLGVQALVLLCPGSEGLAPMGKASVRTKTDTALCTERRGACERSHFPSRTAGCHPKVDLSCRALGVCSTKLWSWRDEQLCLQLLLGRCRKHRGFPMLSQGLLDGCLMGQGCWWDSVVCLAFWGMGPHLRLDPKWLSPTGAGRRRRIAPTLPPQ